MVALRQSDRAQQRTRSNSQGLCLGWSGLWRLILFFLLLPGGPVSGATIPAYKFYNWNLPHLIVGTSVLYSSPNELCQASVDKLTQSTPSRTWSIEWVTWTPQAEGACLIKSVVISSGTVIHYGPYAFYRTPGPVCESGFGLAASGSVCAAVKEIVNTTQPSKTCGGNPIYPLIGTKREIVQTGMSIGRERLQFTYDSSPAAPVALSGPRPPVTKPMALGRLWSSSLHRNVSVLAEERSALVSRGDGRVVSFESSGTNTFTAIADVSDRLSAVTGGFRYFDAGAGTMESYDAQGKLLAIHWADGESLTMSYSDGTTSSTIAPAPGYLIGTQDSRGRTVSFAYDLPAGQPAATGGRLSTVTDTQSQAMGLTYDSVGNLSAITWADGKQRFFHYENSVESALTGVTDELGVRYATFGYDGQGRAISTQYVGGVGLFSTTYTTAPRVVVTESYDSVAQVLSRRHDWEAPQGTMFYTPSSAAAMSVTTVLGKTYLTSRSQPAGSGCAASTSEMDYDANGNVIRVDDFNGTRACYANDMARNLQITKVEGLANSISCAGVTPASASLPSGSRKTSTEWHPDWSLPTRVAEPGKRTTSVYNGQPDPFNGGATASCASGGALLPDGKPIVVLCKQVEQATTDADGSQGFSASLQPGVPARSRQWTYNATGQVLTEADSLNRTTTYAYFSSATSDYKIGDLQSITNAVGQVSYFTKYNGHGQLLEMSDPNGVTTVNTYDARQRLLSTSVGGQTTTFTYDFIGQPKRTTQPDGSWTEYEYDAAHRMNAVKDNQGNRIDYTLDNEGKVTAQNVKDPGGTILRTLTRTLDALGRVQQISGRQ